MLNGLLNNANRYEIEMLVHRDHDFFWWAALMIYANQIPFFDLLVCEIFWSPIDSSSCHHHPPGL